MDKRHRREIESTAPGPPKRLLPEATLIDEFWKGYTAALNDLDAAVASDRFDSEWSSKVRAKFALPDAPETPAMKLPDSFSEHLERETRETMAREGISTENQDDLLGYARRTGRRAGFEGRGEGQSGRS